MSYHQTVSGCGHGNPSRPNSSVHSTSPQRGGDCCGNGSHPSGHPQPNCTCSKVRSRPFLACACVLQDPKVRSRHLRSMIAVHPKYPCFAVARSPSSLPRNTCSRLRSNRRDPVARRRRLLRELKTGKGHRLEPHCNVGSASDDVDLPRRRLPRAVHWRHGRLHGTFG